MSYSNVRVITTEPLAAATTDDSDGFLIVPVGTVCYIEQRFDDGIVDLRTVEGGVIVPSVAPVQYEVDQ